ncbi:MAG: hypothetical protein WBQ25_22755 [Nitrososphaeraceae archaeon]
MSIRVREVGLLSRPTSNRRHRRQQPAATQLKQQEVINNGVLRS